MVLFDDTEGVSALLPSPSEPMAVARNMAGALYKEDKSGAHLLRSWRGGWWRWQQSHWAEVEERSVRTEAYAFTEHADYLKKDEPVPWAPNRYKIADLVDALRSITYLPEKISTPSWLSSGDRPPRGEIVACRNGLLHVTTRTLYEHDPQFFNQVAVPFDYDPSAPRCARWLEFLSELWPDGPDAIAALQEFVGYLVSGRTDLHKILLLIGPTRAGKGVIARVLKHLIGRDNVTGPTLASLGQNFGLQDLIGKPLAIISDARLAGTNVHQIVERLLSVSGEDTLTIDRKYRDPWTGQLPTRFFVISNELPRFGDASGAIAHRFVVLTLEESFLGRENPNLTAELLPELPGILNWALDGLERIAATDRFTEPKSSVDALLALSDLVSPVSAFVRDRCHTAGEVLVDDLWNAWKIWAEDNGHKVGTKQTLGRDLRSVVPRLRVARPRDHDGKSDSRFRKYVGISLQATTEKTADHADRGHEDGSNHGSGPRGPQSDPLCSQVNGTVFDDDRYAQEVATL